MDPKAPPAPFAANARLLALASILFANGWLLPSWAAAAEPARDAISPASTAPQATSRGTEANQPREKAKPSPSPFSPWSATAWMPKKSAFDCKDVRRATLELSVHAYNLANRTTTRTPEGGPFRPRTVECRDAFCTMVIRQNATISVYQPGHADAGANGFVLYPDVAVGSEFAAANAAAAELKLLGDQEICGISSISSANSALIKYGPGLDVASDTLSFTSDGRLSAWSRVGKDGRAYGLQFYADGTASAR